MVTDLARVNVHDLRVMGAVDFKDRLLGFLETAVLRHTKARTTGPAPTDSPDPGGWFTSIDVTDGGLSNGLTFTGGDGGLYGTDGSGEILSVDDLDTRITDVPFEDAAATTYYLSATSCEVPEGISTDTEGAGTFHYDHHRKELGHLAAPTLVVDGGGSITLTLGDHALDAGDDLTGRTAIVYLVDPVTNSPTVAIETCTVSGQTITTVGTLGQSVVSTTAADYEVVLVGPTVTLDATTSRDGWAYIGTVVGGGAPRAFDFSGQPQLVSLEDLSTQSSRLLRKGWLDLPTVTLGGGSTTITVNSGGTVFVNGRVRSPGASAALNPANGAEFWVTWNDGAEVYQLATTWDAANAAGSVPVIWGRTDGGGVIGSYQIIGRRVEEFPETIALTVSEDPDNRAAFRSIEAALGAALSIQKGSTITPVGIVLEVVGDVSVSAAISDQYLQGLVNVTFRGRGSRPTGAGSRIKWAGLHSLFLVSTATLTGWRFEDLTFVASGTHVSDKDGVVSVTTGAVADLQFHRCTVDGSTGFSGGAGGTLPNFVYTEAAGNFEGLKIVDCVVYTTDTIVQVDATGGGALNGLTIERGTYVVSGTAVGAAIGGVLLAGSGGATLVWVADANFTVNGGPCVSTTGVIGLHLHDCRLVSQGADTRTLDLGTGYVLNQAWIHDNYIQQSYGGGAASVPVVRLRSSGADNAAPGVFFHSNMVDGDGATTTNTGLSVEVNATDWDGFVCHSNLFRAVKTGIVFSTAGAGRHVGPIVNGVHVHAGTTGIKLAGVTEPVVSGSYVECSEASALAFDLDSKALVIGCVAVLDDTTGTGFDLAAAVDEVILLGNRITNSATPITLNGGDRSVIAGCIAKDAGLVSVPSGSQKTILLGNQFIDVDMLGSGSMAIANQLNTGTLTYDGTDDVLVANWAEHIVADNDNADRAIVAANHSRTIIPGIAEALVLAANWISNDATFSIEVNNSAVVANVLEQTNISLTANSEDVAFVGNYTGDGTVQDNGTTNVVASNSDT